MRRPPLPLPQDHWRSRWLVLPSWRVLHRISEIEWEGCYDSATDPSTCSIHNCRESGVCEEMIRGRGVSVCGQTGDWHMPGIFSRMGLPRCAHCCDALGIPRGDGCPENKGIST